MLDKFLKATIKANQEIYKKINKKHKKSWQKELNLGAGGDISSGFDIFAEKIFIKHLKKFGKIDSEEAGIVGEGKRVIVIDPLDGSSNAKSYFPYFGSSVALKGKSGKVKVAVVCNFANGEIFYKIKNNPLMVGNLDSLEFKEEKCTKKPQIGVFEKAHENYKIVNELHLRELKFRSPGATALSLAYAHRLNFFIFVGDIREYDFAAGLALCSDLKVLISKDYAIVTHKESLLTTIKDIISEAKQ